MAKPEETLVERLHRQIRRSKAALDGFCEQRRQAINAYAGARYGASDADERPINMMYSLVSTLVPILVAKDPRADIGTWIQPLRPIAYRLEQYMDTLLQEIGFARQFRLVTVDAVFGLGIGRVALVPRRGELSAHEDATAWVPSFQRIGLGDFVFDADAGSLEDAYWMGHRYELPLDYVRDSGWFEGADKLRSMAEARSDRISRGARKGGAEDVGREPFIETAEVYDIWLPPGNEVGGGRGVILTVPSENLGPMVLRTTEWTGPSDGPYETLGFMSVPDNPMPLSPAAVVLNLDSLVNDLVEKLSEQAQGQKSVLTYEPNAAVDAERVVDAENGDAIAVDSVDRIKDVSFGGMDEKTLRATQFFMAAFSRLGGNVNLLGGLAREAQTATEAGLLQGNASVRVIDMETSVYQCAKRCMKKLAWFVFTDPMLDAEFGYKVPGTDISIPLHLDREMLFQAAETMGIPRSRFDEKGMFMKLAFNIRPYSMESDDPARRVARIQALMERTIMPLLQVGMAQGDRINVGGLVRVLAKELQIEEIDEIWTPGGGVPNPLAWNIRAPILPSQAKRAEAPVGVIEPGEETIRLPEKAPPASRRVGVPIGAGE